MAQGGTLVPGSNNTREDAEDLELGSTFNVRYVFQAQSVGIDDGVFLLHQPVAVKYLPSQKLTFSPWKWDFPKGKDGLPTVIFRTFAVSFREGSYHCFLRFFVYKKSDTNEWIACLVVSSCFTCLQYSEMATFFTSQIKNGTKISDDLGICFTCFPSFFLGKPFVMTAAKDEYLVDVWQLGVVAFFMLTGVGSFGFKVILLLIKFPKQQGLVQLLYFFCLGSLLSYELLVFIQLCFRFFFYQAFIPLVPGINLPWYLATSLAIVSSTGPWWRISHSGWLDGPGGAQSSADAAACKVFFYKKQKGGIYWQKQKRWNRMSLKGMYSLNWMWYIGGN